MLIIVNNNNQCEVYTAAFASTLCDLSEPTIVILAVRLTLSVFEVILASIEQPQSVVNAALESCVLARCVHTARSEALGPFQRDDDCLQLLIKMFLQCADNFLESVHLRKMRTLRCCSTRPQRATLRQNPGLFQAKGHPLRG